MKDPPSAQLLELLERCTCLKELNITDCLSVPEQDDSGVSVTLPCLEVIKIQDLMDAGLSLWESLRAPRLQGMYLDLFDWSNTAESALHITPIHRCLRNMRPQVAGISLYDWGVDASPLDNAATLALHCAYPGNIDADWSGPFGRDHKVKLQLTLRGVDTSAPHFINTLNMISSTIDCSSVETLELGSSRDYEIPEWSASLSRLSDIQTLYLQEMSHSRAIQALFCLDKVPGSVPRVEVFPALRVLWLAELDLQGFVPDQEEMVETGSDEASFELIIRSRAESGHPIEHLRVDTLYAIDLGYVRNVFLPELRRLIPTVEVGTVI